MSFLRISQRDFEITQVIREKAFPFNTTGPEWREVSLFESEISEEKLI